jgi:hypothetical protein
MMAFFSFLPTIGEAIAIVLGLMRSNVWLTGGSMLVGEQAIVISPLTSDELLLQESSMNERRKENIFKNFMSFKI